MGFLDSPLQLGRPTSVCGVDKVVGALSGDVPHVAWRVVGVPRMTSWEELVHVWITCIWVYLHVHVVESDNDT